MKDINNTNKKLPCIASPPILAQFTNLLAFLAFYLSPVLMIAAIVHCIRNKKANKKVLDKRTKSYGLWILTLVLFYLVNGAFGSYVNLYVLGLLVLSILLLINLWIGKKYSLFKVRKWYWVIALILFIAIIGVSLVNIPEYYKKQEQESNKRINKEPASGEGSFQIKNPLSSGENYCSDPSLF